jgi:phage-related protein
LSWGCRIEIVTTEIFLWVADRQDLTLVTKSLLILEIKIHCVERTNFYVVYLFLLNLQIILVYICAHSSTYNPNTCMELNLTAKSLRNPLGLWRRFEFLQPISEKLSQNSEHSLMKEMEWHAWQSILWRWENFGLKLFVICKSWNFLLFMIIVEVLSTFRLVPKLQIFDTPLFDGVKIWICEFLQVKVKLYGL